MSYLRKQALVNSHVIGSMHVVSLVHHEKTICRLKNPLRSIWRMNYFVALTTCILLMYLLLLLVVLVCVCVSSWTSVFSCVDNHARVLRICIVVHLCRSESNSPESFLTFHWRFLGLGHQDGEASAILLSESSCRP